MTPAAYPRVFNHCGLHRNERRLRSSSRVGSPLLFGLAPRGVFRASFVAKRAVGSYPTVSPLPRNQLRRRLAGFPARCHRAPFHRRFIFCGTFREPRRTHDVRCGPPGVTRRVYPEACGRRVAPSSANLVPARAEWCPDFPPVYLRRRKEPKGLPSDPQHPRQTSDHPAHPLLRLYQM